MSPKRFLLDVAIDHRRRSSPAVAPFGVVPQSAHLTYIHQLEGRQHACSRAPAEDIYCCDLRIIENHWEGSPRPVRRAPTSHRRLAGLTNPSLRAFLADLARDNRRDGTDIDHELAGPASHEDAAFSGGTELGTLAADHLSDEAGFRAKRCAPCFGFSSATGAVVVTPRSTTPRRRRVVVAVTTSDCRGVKFLEGAGSK